MDGPPALQSILLIGLAWCVVVALLWQHALATFNFKAWPAFLTRKTPEVVSNSEQGDPQQTEGIPAQAEEPADLGKKPNDARPGFRLRRKVLSRDKE